MTAAGTKKKLTKKQLAVGLAKIKAIILDVDGVLTDDHIYFGPDGLELKEFHIGDGLSIVLAMRAGLEIIIMSSRQSKATTSRMNDLGVKHVIQQYGDKSKIITEYLKKLDLDPSHTAFIGNDIMDITLAQKAAIGIAVADAYPELKAVADYVTVKKGGHGAVREILELYFKGRGLDPADFLTR